MKVRLTPEAESELSEAADYYDKRKREAAAAFQHHNSLLSNSNCIKISTHFYKDVEINLVGSADNSFNAAQTFYEHFTETMPSTIVLGMANKEYIDKIRGGLTRRGILRRPAALPLRVQRRPGQVPLAGLLREGFP